MLVCLVVYNIYIYIYIYIYLFSNVGIHCVYFCVLGVCVCNTYMYVYVCMYMCVHEWQQKHRSKTVCITNTPISITTVATLGPALEGASSPTTWQEDYLLKLGQDKCSNQSTWSPIAFLH